MAQLNMDALKDLDKELAKSGTGSKLFLHQKDLTDETMIRLMPSTPSMGGLFFIKIKRYWLNNIPYICWSTFGKKSAIEAELTAGIASGDEDIVSIIRDPKKVKEEEIYWSPILHLFYHMNEKGRVKSVEVVDEMPKVFEYGRMMLKDLTKVVLNRIVQNDTTDGIADRAEGFNIACSKTGQKLNTEYSAMPAEQMEMSAKYYQDTFDVYEIAKSQAKSQKYLKAIVRQLLYGEPIPQEAQEMEDARVAKNKAEWKEKMKAKEASAPPAKKKKPVVEDEEEEAPVVKKKKPPVVDDLPFEEDEEPVVVKKKKPVVVEDDEEDEPAPVVKKKKAPVADDFDEEDEPPAPKPKKKPPVVDDFEDDEEEEAPVVKKKKPVVVEDDEEEEAPAPPKKKAPVKKAPVVDEFDDDDEEPAAKPAPKKRNMASDINAALDIDDDDDF